MSETQEARSPLSGQERQRKVRPHKYKLVPLHNGHSDAPGVLRPLVLAAIANSDTRKIAALAPTEQAAQQGDQRAASGHFNGHLTIEEQETLKVSVPQGSARQPGGRSAVVNASLLVAAYPLRQLLHLRRFSRPLFAAVIIVPLLALLLAGTLEYLQLQQPYDNLYAVDAASGSVRWQLPAIASVQPLAIDGQGILAVESMGKRGESLVALASDGRVLWHGLTSSYEMSLPAATARPGSTLVVAGEPLHGTNGQSMWHPLTLYRVDRATGAAIWQRTLVSVTDYSAAFVLGADARFVYAALVQVEAQGNTAQPAAVLEAISQDSGAPAWSVEEPLLAHDASGDSGKVLVQGTTAYWQVAGTIYAIDTTTGRVMWRHLIPGNDIQAASGEESQMVVTDNALIVARSLAYYALDITNGAELWTIPNPAQEFGAPPASSGLAASGTTIYFYGGGQVDAFDSRTHRIVWEQKQLDGIQRLVVSRDGKLLYVVVSDSVEGNQPTQALVALDTANGGARWTFQPTGQVAFLPVFPGGAAYLRGALLAAVCLTAQSPCPQPMLYALNPFTGSELWKIGGTSIENVIISQDGGVVLLQRQSSGWLDLLVGLRSP